MKRAQPIKRVALRRQRAGCTLDPGRPVIVTDALEGWPALGRWSAEYLTERVGSARVGFKVSSRPIHPDYYSPRSRRVRRTEHSTLADYLARISGGAGSAHYFLSGDEVRLHSDTGKHHRGMRPLLDDIRVPPGVDSDRLYMIGLWLSGRGLISAIHFDSNGCHNYNAQVTGEKRVVLFPPSELPLLYPFPIFDPRSNALPSFSRVDIEKPDHRRFPKFRFARRYEGVLRAGEALFVPAFWFHSFEHTGRFNANVNFWWVPSAWELNPTAVRWRVAAAMAEALRHSRKRSPRLDDLEAALIGAPT